MLLFAFSGAFLAFGAPAGSQGTEPYVSPFGDLTIVADELLPGSTVMLSGDGFTPETPVFLTVRQNATAEVLVENDGEADLEGAVEFELELTEAFEPGGYSAMVRGTTIDGAILDLSGGFNVDGPEEPTATPTPDSVTLPTPRPTSEPAPVPTATAVPTPRPPILGPTPTPEGEPTPTPTPIDLGAGAGDDEGDAEVLGESIDDGDSGASTGDGGGDGASGGTEDATAQGDGDVVASGDSGEPASTDSGGDEVAAPAIEGSGGIGGGAIAGILAAVALIGGGAFAMYRRSTRTVPTHAE